MGAPLEFLDYRVPASESGARLDVWLSSQGGAPSRSQVKVAAEQGRILVDGKPARASLRLRGGETVRLQALQGPAGFDDPECPGAEDIALDILYEDDAVLLVNKPAGLVVHPAAGNRSGTLVNAILHRYPSSRWPGRPDRAGIVHRLDRDTSGVLVVARNVEAHEAISRQFRERRVKKRYLAVVRGRVLEAGEIDAPVGRHSRDRKKMSTAARSGRHALTRYEPLELFAAATLLAVYPETGRTHQIRVHLASRGWPVVADGVYGGGRAKTLAQLPAAAAMGRQALHASVLTFAHPVSGRTMSIEAPLPPDFESLLDRLRA